MARELNSPRQTQVSFAAAFRVWLRVAWLSFGGPAGQIAVMHRILVEEKKWISEQRFLHALNYCMLLPGPEAQQLATYIGWLLHGTRGGIMAGGLFVLPGFVALMALSMIYAEFQQSTVAIQAVFFGLKAAVLIIVMEAVLRIGRRVLKNKTMVGIAGAAFVGLFFFRLPFPLIIALAAALGLLCGRLWPATFLVLKGHGPKHTTEPGGETRPADIAAESIRTSGWHTFLTALVWLVLWFAPLPLVAATLGREHVLFTQGLFFSKAAVVTFGGAYAVLPYVAQQAVETHGWLTASEMLDGLGMAETTPGPLIIVLEFVGFLGAYRHPGTLTPRMAGVLGACLTVWTTFIPSFLWIFAGAPYVEKLRGQQRLNAALGAITAAVVGVVLNLAVWFSLHTLFAKVDEIRRFGILWKVPAWHTLNQGALAVALLAAWLTFVRKQGMFVTLAVCTAVGVVVFLLTLPAT